MVGWWKLDEGSGTVTADASGNGQTGTLESTSGQLPAWTNGVVGGALAFSGYPYYGNDVTVPVPAFSQLTTRLTVSTWINVANDGNTEVLDWGPDRNCGFMFLKTGTTVNFQVRSAATGQWATSAGVTAPSNVWTHVAGVYDGSTLQIYQNGVAVGDPVTITGLVAACSGNLTMAHLPNSGRYFTGQLGDVRVYSRALSRNEVAALYNTDTVGDGIPNWWRYEYFGSGTSTDVNSCATCNPSGDQIDNLQKYDYGLNPVSTDTVDVLVNNGSTWATNQTITLSASAYPFPFVEVSLYPNMSNATVLANTGAPLTYLLPSTNNATYYLYLQYTDAQTNALGPVLFKPITLDTIPPWIEITSPTNSTGSDAFVHLQATVFDPDPQNPTAPGVFRPVKIWINGQPYWNLSNHQIDIPRYPVAAYSNNLITIVAQDQAGNTTEAGVSIYINPTNTAPPTLTVTGFAPNTVTDIPDESSVWVSGQMDDLNAIVTASVNGSDPISMNVRSNQFGYILPVDWGTNTVLIMGANAAGYASTNVFTLVCGNRYQFAFTTPAPGTYINNSNVQVVGYVSAFRDASLPTQTGVVSVTVNGIPTTLTDGGGGLTNFTTIVPVPVPSDGSALVLNAVVTWADGSTDPSAEAEGYYIIASKQTYVDHQDVTYACGSGSAGGYSIGEDLTWTFSALAGDNNTVGITHSFETGTDCSGQPYSSESDSTNVSWVAQPSWSLRFGCEAHEEDYCGPSGAWSQSNFYTSNDDGEMTVVPPWNYAPGTWVVLTFWGLSYGTAYGAPPADLSTVTFQGQAPIAGQPGSYLVQMSGDTPFTISAGSFGWPEADDADNNGCPYFFDSWDDLWFSGFSNQQILPLIQVSNLSHDGSKNPGAAVVCNCDNNSPARQQIFVTATYAPPGTYVTLTIPNSLKVFTAQTGGTQINSGTSLSILPTNLWVEGEQVSSQMMDARITAQINGSGPSDYVTFTVVWATMTYMTSGTAPANAPAFPSTPSYEAGSALGVSYSALQNAAAGKMCAVATVAPAGVHTYFSNGWNMVQQIMQTTFKDGAVDPAHTSTVWTNDGPQTGNYTTNLDSAEKLYAIDGPNIGHFTNANDSCEVYDDFYVYARWNTQRCCSTNTCWHWRGRWKVDQSPQVTMANVGSGMITIPTNAFYSPP
jgi:hypothetical protein